MHVPLGHRSILKELRDSCHRNAPTSMTFTFLQHETNALTDSNPTIPRPFGDSKEEAEEMYTCR